MGIEFLARVRRTSLWLVGLTALVVATYVTPRLGVALALGTAWSLVNLELLTRLIVALTGPDRAGRSARTRALLALSGMLALFAVGGLLLWTLPPVALAIGFSAPFLVMTLKAASSLLLGSRAWDRLTRLPWGVAALALLAAAAVALTVSALPRAAGSQPHAAPAIHAQAAEHAAGGAEHGAAAEHAAEGESGGSEEFPNFIGVLVRAFPNAAWAPFLHQWEVLVFSFLVALLLCVVAWLASRNAQLMPGRLQNVVEALVEGLRDFIVDILGPRYGPRYVPFLGTLFLYIWAMNLFGLIPFMHSPTSNLNVTVSLALVVFVYSQYIGFRELGALGWLDHMAGNPRSAISWGLVPLMLPIHLMGELAKPISLSCRLFGNVFGEDMLLVAFASLGVTALSFAHLPFGLPLQLPFLFLALLTSTLQALVFTVLSTIYFLLMLPHDDHGHEGEAHAH